ncbi:AAA family ATPase [Anabaena cylindrica FACHB-243]|uniref:Lipopolysaccharide biosynthesis protein n=1 Tax=Anabaena cylindrica (strain ATCC 27899 / PCC 7122) TaxID=272123 RepID=K9ZMC1_ANACC|nr:MULTISPECIES: tyrosine-protein kinase domain-containing protein [Anabaena]AFZ60346.1 lipopolysaccharide biosynthesis protein [Anabaena cylindrica PCC 7122]MBD2418928.1 AAA family ATPase [Anabaena cylindrica FACHB-243]MBY5284848.1 AAA family ATPase [Anabaena sp. CCAP 1446/1C]MBY5309456.1 AAA family ATPase [Anabaena sp. CCAP 1446/1C]MCM2404519.1 AAA family ATPase [Anabaena sp. CCAP 1446/1C]
MTTTGLNRKQLLKTSKQRVFNIRQISNILLHRRYLILGFSCAVMSVTSLIAVITKPMYQSSMQLMVSSDENQGFRSSNIHKSAKNELTNLNNSSTEYTDQMKLMLSSKLLQKTVDLLLSDYHNLTIEDLKGKINTANQGSLQVAPTEGKSAFNQIFLVSFKDPNPVKTKRVLQALQKVYQDYNIEQRQERVNQGLAFVNNRLPKLQQEVLTADKKLEFFRKKHNLIDPEVQSKILLDSLVDIQKQRKIIRSQLEDIQIRYSNLEKQLVSSSQNARLAASLSRSSSYQALVDEIRNTEMTLAQERLRYTENSPVVVRLMQKRKIQMALLEKELQEQAISANSKSQNLLGVDSNLANELKKLQKTGMGLIANENNLAKFERNISSQLNIYPGIISEYNRLLSDVTIQRKTLEQLLQLQQTLGMRIAQGGFNWQVLEEPDLGIYIGNRKWLLIIGGILIGPILGMIFALIWEMFNKAIFSPQDLQNLTNLRLLGSVPKLGKSSVKNKLQQIFRSKRQSSSPTITESNTKLSSHETLDMIYQNIQIFKQSLPFKSLMLTSALPGEGKTTLTLGLGASAAHMHQRVLVIDANLRSPSLHKILNISNDWGLSLLLLDDVKTQVHNYIQPIHPSIDILTAGPTPEDVVNLLSSEKLKELIESCEQMYDLVLIDASSVLDSVDARIIASACNGIVIVGRIGQLTPQELMQATEILSQLNLIGIVANEVHQSPKVKKSSERADTVKSAD